MLGKHSEERQLIKELAQVIEHKEKEQKDLKAKALEKFKEIKNLNECNNYGNEKVMKRKISEICSDIISELSKDTKKEL